MSLQESARSVSQHAPLVPKIRTFTAARPPTNKASLSVQEAKEVWQHTVLLFKHYDWSESVVYTQRLLRRSQQTPGINRAAIWANLGILRMHLGEYYLALEAFEKAMKEAGVSATDTGRPKVQPTILNTTCATPLEAIRDALPSHLTSPQPHRRSHAAATATPSTAVDDLSLLLISSNSDNDAASLTNPTADSASASARSGSTSANAPTRRHHHHHHHHHHIHKTPPPATTAVIYPFLAASAAYHLARSSPSSDTTGLRTAQRLFRTCLALLPADDETAVVDLAQCGLSWVLERVRVVWNERICGVEAEWEEGGRREGVLVAGRHWGINGVPGGLCFEFVGEGGGR